MKPFVFDAVQHIIEPPELWTSRLPKNLRDQAPRVVQVPEGGEAWSFEGSWLRPIGLEAAAGHGPLDLKREGYAYADIREGAYDPDQRLRDLAEDGIDAASIFPTYGMSLRHFRDPELEAACVEAYNDAVWEWSRAKGTERLIPHALIPTAGLDGALKELRRVVKQGFRGIVFCGWPKGGDQPQSGEEPFWALCEEAGVVINLVNGGPNISAAFDTTGPPPPGGHPPLAALWTGRSSPKGTNVTNFVMLGILERFPALNLALIEAGAGWIPYFKEQLDDMYRRGRWWAHAKLRYRPSEYIVRQVKATVEGDRFAIEAREDLGVGSLMWGSAYPASTTTWPLSRLAADDQLRGVPEAERRRILGVNAAALYGLKDKVETTA